MSDLTNKDAEQDSKLAVLESKIESYRERIHALEADTSNVSVIDSTLENAVRRIELVHERIDRTENKIKELDNELRGRIRKNEIWIAGAGAVIAAATTIIGLALSAESMEVNYGCYGPAQQEVLLQF
jgi:predicted RNase H-like nuclease (RuvC/YqgF family)